MTQPKTDETPRTKARLEDSATPGRRISDLGGETALADELRAAMLRKLAKNRGKLHWREPEVRDTYLINRLREEVGELEEAVRSGSGEAAWNEAADVANFAAMLADRREAAAAPSEPPRPTRFHVDGHDFDSAEAVNRYLVSDHTKAELIDLLMVFIEELVAAPEGLSLDAAAFRATVTALADVPFEPGPYLDGWRAALKDVLYWLDKARLSPSSGESDPIEQPGRPATEDTVFARRSDRESMTAPAASSGESGSPTPGDER